MKCPHVFAVPILKIYIPSQIIPKTMKYVNMALVIALICAIPLYGYITDKATTIDVSVVVDITDSMASFPESNSIIKLYDLQANPWNGGSFEARSITDISMNRSYTVKIPSNRFTDRVLSNEIERKKSVKRFTEGVSEIVDSISANHIGRKRSSVYRLIANELIRLSTMTSADRKILLIYSDLREFSDFLNLYDKRNMVLLKSRPDSIAQLFSNQVALPDLSGIEVWFVFQPVKYEEDESYLLISQVYKGMLEANGAKVMITANLSM